MRLRVHLQKESVQMARDPVGLAAAFAVPFLIVWVFSLLDLGDTFLPSQYRETSPVALILALSTWLSMLGMASGAVYRERLGGLLQRLSVTPFSPGLMITAKGVVYLALGVLQSIVVWYAARWLLPQQLEGADDAGGLVSLSFLAFATLSLGLLLSAAVTSATQLANAVTFLTLGMITLSGFFKPLGDLGRAGSLGQVLPFTHGYRSLSAVAEGADPPRGALLGMIAEGIAFLALAFLLIRQTGRTNPPA